MPLRQQVAFDLQGQSSEHREMRHADASLGAMPRRALFETEQTAPTC
jgi:hypothetical protein